MAPTFDVADTLHRLVKEALDSGTAETLADAEAMFRGFKLHFTIGEAEAGDPQHQAALLTGVALAQRVFQGGVGVSGALGTPLRVPLGLGSTLSEAVTTLGGVIEDQFIDRPLVTIGGGAMPRAHEFHVRTVQAGWRGGIVPAQAKVTAVGGPSIPLSPMLAAALAVNEAFSFVRTGNPALGRRAIGLSLWNPSPEVDWLAEPAGKAIGAPFVGAVASCLALSEVLRLLYGGPIHQVIDLDLQGLEHRSAVGNPYDFSGLNPGFVLVT